MPREPRGNIETNYIHLIMQGINKEYIFEKEEWKEEFIKIVKTKIENTNIEILAYCIMDNHVHILIYYSELKMLSNVMRKINTTYAMRYNRINKRKGFVFRDRYFIQPIIDEKQLYNCLVYIHMNPVEAGICDQMEEYGYSSYNEYRKEKRLISDNSIKLVFGSKTKYMEKFNEIHNNLIEIKNIKDVKENEYNTEEIIKRYTDRVGEKLEGNEIEFAKLLLEIREKCGMSLREMSKLFKINKDKLNKYMHKIIDK